MESGVDPQLEEHENGNMIGSFFFAFKVLLSMLRIVLDYINPFY